MEKSGPRHKTERNPLIIERPDLQSWPQRALSGALTTIFWMLWLLLWLPLVTLAGWVIFGWQFKIHMFDLGGNDGFLELIGACLAVIAVMGFSLLIWAKYNHLRFRNVERRKAFPAVTLEMLAARIGHPEPRLQAWQLHKVVVVEHGHEGEVLSVLPLGERLSQSLASEPSSPVEVPGRQVRKEGKRDVCHAL